ncbi:MAG: hypothetical protein N3I86_01685, partial [Verrucomicrobiae bacterium]|nr:hypothetical protein [Verrucomicrobiae bacterium]
MKPLLPTAITAVALALGKVTAAPVLSPWPLSGFNDAVASAAARLGGTYAVADAYEDKVEIRDIRQKLRRTITRTDILTLLPWMSLDGGPDGPSGLAVSDSGRLVFLLVHDDTAPSDGGPTDGVLRYDTLDETLRLFCRVNLFDRGDRFPWLAAVHYQGRLYVGTAADGLRVFSAGLNDSVGTLVGSAALPGGGPVRGLAVDATAGLLFAAGSNALYRAALTSSPLTFQLVGHLSEIRAIAFSSHFGGPTQAGLYVLAGGASNVLYHVPSAQARGHQPFAPGMYLTVSAHDVAATACGRLLLATDETAHLLADNTDPRLDFDAWLTNELDQVIHFAKALVAADGRGAGWVTDADTAQGLPRFHPCSPDGAAWVVLGLLLADVVRGDAQALPLTRDILRRHAGLAPDGVAPQRSADGIYRHWYNPTNGGPYPGWDTEFATLSTMKIVAAAVRARRHFRNDSVVRIAADTIANTIRNHAAYVREQPDGLYFKALPGGGPDVWSLSLPFHEGILFVEQAAAFADPVLPRYARWLDRARWPTAELVTGKPVTGNVPGWFQAAFVTLYPWLLQKDFRSSPAWQHQVKHLWYSQAAWNDANGPQWFAVFSAGTTPGGYNADSLSHHPHDIASFPALLAFCAAGDTAPAVSA